MDNKMIFADDITACPECGSVVFWFNYTGGGEDKEIMFMDCVMCGAKYYGRNYYQQRLAMIKADNKKKSNAEKQ